MMQDIDEISRISVLKQLSNAVWLDNYLSRSPKELEEHLIWAKLEYGDNEYEAKYIDWMERLKGNEWVATNARVLANAILN